MERQVLVGEKAGVRYLLTSEGSTQIGGSRLTGGGGGERLKVTFEEVGTGEFNGSEGGLLGVWDGVKGVWVGLMEVDRGEVGV